MILRKTKSLIKYVDQYHFCTLKYSMKYDFQEKFLKASQAIKQSKYSESLFVLRELLDNLSPEKQMMQYLETLYMRGNVFYQMRIYNEAQNDFQMATNLIKEQTNNDNNNELLIRFLLNELALNIQISGENILQCGEELMEKYLKSCESKYLKGHILFSVGVSFQLQQDLEYYQRAHQAYIDCINLSDDPVLISYCLHNIAVLTYWTYDAKNEAQQKLSVELNLLQGLQEQNSSKEAYAHITDKIQNKQLEYKDLNNIIYNLVLAQDNLIEPRDLKMGFNLSNINVSVLSKCPKEILLSIIIMIEYILMLNNSLYSELAKNLLNSALQLSKYHESYALQHINYLYGLYFLVKKDFKSASKILLSISKKSTTPQYDFLRYQSLSSLAEFLNSKKNSSGDVKYLGIEADELFRELKIAENANYISQLQKPLWNYVNFQQYN